MIVGIPVGRGCEEVPVGSLVGGTYVNDVGSATMVVGTPSLGSVKVAVGTRLVTGGFSDEVSITLVGMTMVTGVEGGALETVSAGSLTGTDEGVAIGVDGGAVSVGGKTLVEFVSPGRSVDGGRGVVMMVDGPGVGGKGGRSVSELVELPSSGGVPMVVDVSPGKVPVVVVLGPGVGTGMVELSSPGGRTVEVSPGGPTEVLVPDTSGAEVVVVVSVSGGNRVIGGRIPPPVVVVVSSSSPAVVVMIELGAEEVLLVSGSGLRIGSKIGSRRPPLVVVVVGSASGSLVTSSASVVVGSGGGRVVVGSREVGSDSSVVSASEVEVLVVGSRMGSRIGSKMGSKRPPLVVVGAGSVVSSASVLVASSGTEVVPGRVLGLLVVESGASVGSSSSVSVASDVAVVAVGREETEVVVSSSSPPRRGSSPPISPGMTIPVGPIMIPESVSVSLSSLSVGSGFKIWSMSPRRVVVSAAGSSLVELPKA
jgi:hypothetical protein